MTDYSGSPSDYENLIHDVAMDQNNCQLPSVSAAMDAWQTYGTMLQDVMRPNGHSSNGFVNGDGLAPQLSIGDLAGKYLSGWSGPAMTELLNQLDQVRDFGYQVGGTMFGSSDSANQSFHAALSTVNTALTGVINQYPSYKKARDDWLSNLTDNMLNFRSYFARTNPAQNLPKTTTVDVAVTPNGGPINPWQAPVHLTFTINDGAEQHSYRLDGMVNSTGRGAAVSVVSPPSPDKVSSDLSSRFTKGYLRDIGPLADKITANSGGYVAASARLPGKVDDSKLPPGPGGNQSTPGAGNWTGSGGLAGGGGLGNLGGPNGTGLSGDLGKLGGSGSGSGSGSGGGPLGDLAKLGGTSGTGSGREPLSGLGLTGSGTHGGSTGLGGQPFSGSGGTPTRLAGFSGGTPGSGTGIGGLPLGGGRAFGAGGLGKLASGGPSLGGVGGLGALGDAGGGSGPGALGSAYGTNAGLGATGAGVSGLGAAATAGEPMPMMPPMMPPGMAGNTDNTRQRKSWLPEDDDIWIVDQVAVPPVISNES